MMIEKIKSPIKYFIYARKSSESEDKQVASVSSQIKELKDLAKQRNLNILEILTEEKSAKAPGRPVFNRMMEDIQQGKAQGIICWKLDRLARNPVDGGQIGWLLQQSIIKHIQTYQREYFPTDNVLMMNLEFGMANQFVLDLSVNTKRGLKNKAEEGWLPSKSPLGYLNNKYNLPDLSPIYNDQERFSLMRQLWDILIEKQCSINSLYQKSLEIGLVTDKGKPIARSKFYSLFKNPFYYGSFNWNGKLYSGKHEPMITKAEYDLAQEIISGNKPSFYNNHIFAFTGMIKCGECGAGITAEKKTKHQKNGNIHHYTYYHCTKQINPKCTQKTIRDTELERQIIETLDKIEIPSSFHQWAIKHLKEEQSKETVDRDEILKSQQKRLDTCKRKLNSLFEMRINDEMDASEYMQRKEKLAEEKQRFEQLIADNNHRFDTWLDNAEKLFSFAETAKKRFESGNLVVKREILACLGSNLILLDRKLSIQLQEPLSIFTKYSPELKVLHNRLEPLQDKSEQEVMEVISTGNEIWGGGLWSLRRI
ncbi:MAG: recombinase family protein [Candidatus Scalindua sp.]|nr:recombinase family protein [Candidatus Scalindua sp.]